MPHFRKTFTLNCKGRLLVIDKPLVMGILNATPDSFYNKGRDSSFSALCHEAEKMLSEGAAILDIGGMSTRPGAAAISVEEEKKRILPVIEQIKENFPETFLSVDTFRADVATAAVATGADIVNDISAGNLDPDMPASVARLNVPYIAMHMQGTPADMQNDPRYENVTLDILKYFIEKIKIFSEAGIKDIIIDPGFGFGKTIKHNYELLKGLTQFRILDQPLLTGVSRKSMIYRLLNTSAEESLSATSALHMLCLQNGAHILRVHDVREASECIRLFQYYGEPV